MIENLDQTSSTPLGELVAFILGLIPGYKDLMQLAGV